jgi:hypothetical protein
MSRYLCLIAASLLHSSGSIAQEENLKDTLQRRVEILSCIILRTAAIYGHQQLQYVGGLTFGTMGMMDSNWACTLQETAQQGTTCLTPPYGPTLNRAVWPAQCDDPYGFMPLSFLGHYRTTLTDYWANSTAQFSARALDGLYGGKVGITKENRKGSITYGFWFKAMYRPKKNGTAYLLDRQHWVMGEWNNSFALTLDHRYTYGQGSGEINVEVRSSNLGSDHDYHYLRAAAINRTELWMLKLHSRGFVQLGYGTDWAIESQLYIDRASPEEMADNRFTRSAGIFPAQWGEYGVVPNHLHHGGGLNLRGYAGYLAPEMTGDDVALAYSGANGAAINLELDFDRLLGSDRWPLQKWLKLETYVFGDAGIISINAPDAAPAFAMPRADAGLGLALTIRQWGPIMNLKPLTLRFDMPFFVSRPAAMQPDNWRFRWVVGIGRTF